MTPTPPVKENMAMAFATPIVAYRWPDSDALNADLRAVILQAEAAQEGIVRSNVGGWHSNTDFFSWDADCIRGLKERIRALIVELTRCITVGVEKERTFKYRLQAWANVLRSGGYHTVHNHPGCLWAGVYYIADGDLDPEGGPSNGKLELIDPRAGVQMIHIDNTILHGRYQVDPLPGLMVVFPAWLNHMVHPFVGKGERISISFNVLLAEAPKADGAGEL